ncbi:NADH:ubiquinone oxidoreductase [Sinorhizobium prairiense]|uniref:NADH:ubiquinone oxidoreductase n=1 Tax=unclassified Sinorhizobium TaxID=2613772 RepID=UPI0023D7BF40|nr:MULTISPECIES: NADH:ubiquinone oxidoreductase [unclassified Sinorhizobium]WEJ11196.1 NADH:ubiquinone oxidoreductase [Sinorhizobium sp. M103]WEJ14204.1 NADH:ubiquinone oxidoreductase [Sinorhizobium sp. K101]WEJ38181.1 NADH:ubiquinone oxidoreductase [Sinorhizobium sp. C101]
MAGARKDGQGRTAASAAGSFAWPQGADPADPFGMGEWMKNLSNAGLPSVGLHPLMAHPAAAVAAATALGFGLSSHIAGMMFGAMQGAASTLRKSVAAPDQAEISKPAPVARPQKAALRKAPVSAVATRKPRRPVKRAAAPAAGLANDDLKQISGIGPKLEQVLNGRGIFRFADIAALSKADVERLDSELGLAGRVVRDDWIGQAKALTGAREK